MNQAGSASFNLYTPELQCAMPHAYNGASLTHIRQHLTLCNCHCNAFSSLICAAAGGESTRHGRRTSEDDTVVIRSNHRVIFLSRPAWQSSILKDSADSRVCIDEFLLLQNCTYTKIIIIRCANYIQPANNPS